MVACQNPIIQYLVIPSGATTGERIVIDGINGTITTYNASNNVVWQVLPDGTMIFINADNTGMIRIEPNGEVGTGLFPGIYFFAANTPGAYANPAWLQANPDAANNPQVAFNGGPFIDTSGLHLSRGRMFLEDHVSSLNIIDTATQTPVGGSLEAWDTVVKIAYYDPATGNEVGLYIDNTVHGNTQVPVLFDVWKNVTLANGWTNSGGNPVQVRFDTSGYVRMRGQAVAGTKADATLMFTIPAAYVPTTTKLLSICTGGGGTFLPNQRVTIDTGGNVQCFSVNSAAVANVSFDGIMFESALYTA